MTFLHAITYLYGATGVAIIGSYVPQIRAAWRSVGGARDVSLLTWGFWVVTALISCLYAGLVVRDLGILLMGVGNLVGCLSVVATTVWRRSRLAPLESQWRPEPTNSLEGVGHAVNGGIEARTQQ